MSRQQAPDPHPPLTDTELAGVEQQARQLANGLLGEGILRLVAEVRRSRATRAVTLEQTAVVPIPQTALFDPDDTPPGGRVTMAEWQAIAELLEAGRGPMTEARRLSPAEQEERRRRWQDLGVRMGWDTQTPPTPEQEASLDALIREEIKAHRRQKQRKRERHAGGR